jgi:hypothetical protein
MMCKKAFHRFEYSIIIGMILLYPILKTIEQFYFSAVGGLYKLNHLGKNAAIMNRNGVLITFEALSGRKGWCQYSASLLLNSKISKKEFTSNHIVFTHLNSWVLNPQ